MGYTKELFLTPSTIDVEFICCICHEVLADPTMSISCEHVFCKSCINTWKSSSKTCPLDRVKLTNLRSPQRIFFVFYNRLELRCSFSSNGCNSIVNLGNKVEHESKCTFNPEVLRPCTSNSSSSSTGGCGAMLTAMEISSHNCIIHLQNVIAGLKKELEEAKNENVEKDSKNKELQLQISQLQQSTLLTSSRLRTRISAAPSPSSSSNLLHNSNNSNPKVFFDLTVNQEPLGRLTIELQANLVPMAAQVFRSLCLGNNGIGYKRIHATLHGARAMSFRLPDTRRLRSIVGPPFAKEGFNLTSFNFNRPGVVVMEEHDGTDKLWCDFEISLGDFKYEYEKEKLVGVVIEGLDILEIIQDSHRHWFRNDSCVIIQNCGECS